MTASPDSYPRPMKDRVLIASRARDVHAMAYVSGVSSTDKQLQVGLVQLKTKPSRSLPWLGKRFCIPDAGQPSPQGTPY